MEVSYLPDVEGDDARRRSQREQHISGVSTIVFATMCLEAAIFDFGAHHLGDQYFADHIEKLDLLSKWVVLPRLVCDYTLDKSTAAFEYLKRTVMARNRLVHSKSERMDFSDIAGQIDKLEKESDWMHDSVHLSFKSLVLLSLTLDRDLGSAMNPLPSFDTETTFPPESDPEILRIISESKSSISKQRAF